jgi:ATP-dependent RNA helicase DeaD
LLVKLMKREQPRQAIIFCRTKRGTERVFNHLRKKFERVECIHGDLQQNVRDRVMAAFREDKIQLLVATDVVGRGIDVTNISHIINYDIPAFCDDYVHRVGRTGRMGREGVAYTFVTPEEGQELTKIEVRIGRLLTRAEIEGYQAFQKPIAKPTSETGEPDADGDGEPAEPKKQVPVFGRPVRRIRRAL